MFRRPLRCSVVNSAPTRPWLVITALFFSQGLTDTKISSSSSRFHPMSVIRVPHHTDLTPAYSQHSLHRSVSRLIDGKSLMMEEGHWDGPPGHDSGLVSTEEILFPGIL